LGSGVGKSPAMEIYIACAHDQELVRVIMRVTGYCARCENPILTQPQARMLKPTRPSDVAEEEDRVSPLKLESRTIRQQ